MTTKTLKRRKPTIIDKIPEADEVREMYRSLTLLCIRTLADVMENSSNDAARTSAAREALDRGWGKSHTIPSGEVTPHGKIEVIFGTPPEIIGQTEFGEGTE